MASSAVLMPQTSNTAAQKVSYLPNLTPLRGIAALLTVFFHFNIDLGWVYTKAGFAFIDRMYLMVDFFFILSGFIMYHVYAKSFMSGVSAGAFKQFTIARFSRVYPLHLATLLYVVALFTITGSLGMPKEIVETENSLYSFFTNIFLVQSMNLHLWFSWVHASWSISVEWWAYMIFPFLVVPFSRLTSIGRMITCLACFAGYLCITFLLVPIVTVPPSIPFVANDPAKLTIDVSYQYGIVRCLCGFILGMMMYQGFLTNWGRKVLSNGYTMLALAAAFFVLAQFQLPDVFTVRLLPLVLLCGAYGSQPIDKVFGTKALQKLGDWSFSIYLVHQPVLYTVSSVMNYLSKDKPAGIPQPVFGLGSSFLISLVLMFLIVFIASLSYKYLEVPARKKLNAMAGKRS